MDAMEMSYGLVGKEKTDGGQATNRNHFRNKLPNFHIGSDPSARGKRQPEGQNQLNCKNSAPMEAQFIAQETLGVTEQSIH